MLPSLLNSSYDKILYPQPSLDPTLKVKLFGEKNEVSFSSLDAADQAQVMRLVRKGDLLLEYKAKDKKQIKTEKRYRVNLEGLKELQPSERAKKRLALKERLLLEQGEQPLAGLYQEFSREVVAYFIDQGVLEITEREVNRAAAYYEGKEQTQALLLNSEQAKAVETVVSQIGKTSKPFY